MSEPYRTEKPLASGVVTMLFTDIEGSTALWERDAARMSQALAAHDALVRRAVELRHGMVVKMTGDGMHAVFDDALNALAATVDLQQALADSAATNGISLPVRCGLHAGVVERRDNDYFGTPVNRAARLMGAAHGGQVLLSQAVVDFVQDTLPAAVSLRDLGRVRLRDLSTPEHVYQVLHPQLRQAFPPLRSLEATPNNMPQQVTSFIGREQELAELQRLLAKTRLLTLIGSGGCGKTRLCLQTAADSLDRFADGAWFVELAPLADPSLIPQTIATVLGVKEEADKPIIQTLAAHLKDRRLLLLLDNCEHLLDGCARLVDTLLRQCAQVTVLASSREALGISGEQAYRVPSLSLPDANQVHTPASVARFEAVRLFTDRASLARPDFQVSEQNASILASICLRLDGIPLAIELAAARVRSLSVEVINRKLDQRFLLLTGGSRTALPRQQTLRSLIDWSYDLLRHPEQQLLQRLSVFAGGWTLETAEQVCAGDGVAFRDVVDLLTSLCDKSLAIVEQSDQRSRYRLLETVRQYARERLLEAEGSETIRQRHRACFVTLAEMAAAKLIGAEKIAWLLRLEQEHENLRASLQCSLTEAESEASLRLCGALWRFWLTRGYLSEGRAWCAQALHKASEAEVTPAHALALHAAGVLAFWQADYVDAQAKNEESLAIRRQLGDRRGTAVSLNNLGNVAAVQGNFASARILYEECLVIWRELGDRWGTAASLNNLGNVNLDQGNFPQAKALYEESLAISRELGEMGGVASVLSSLGTVAYEQDDYATARSLFEHCLEIQRELGDRLGMASSLSGLAAVTAALGRSTRAARVWGTVERLRAELGAPMMPSERQRHDRWVTASRAALGDDSGFDRAWQEGRTLTLENAIEAALEKTVERRG